MNHEVTRISPTKINDPTNFRDPQIWQHLTFVDPKIFRPPRTFILFEKAKVQKLLNTNRNTDGMQLYIYIYIYIYIYRLHKDKKCIEILETIVVYVIIVMISNLLK